MYGHFVPSGMLTQRWQHTKTMQDIWMLKLPQLHVFGDCEEHCPRAMRIQHPSVLELFIILRLRCSQLCSELLLRRCRPGQHIANRHKNKSKSVSINPMIPMYIIVYIYIYHPESYKLCSIKQATWTFPPQSARWNNRETCCCWSLAFSDLIFACSHMHHFSYLLIQPMARSWQSR